MRALASLLVSVLLLALVQAGYNAAASAEETHKGHKEDLVKRGHHHEHNQHHRSHDRQSHNVEENLKQKDKTDRSSEKAVPHTAEDKKQISHRKDRKESNPIPVIPPFFEEKHHHNRYEIQEDDDKLPLVNKNKEKPKVNVRVERVDVSEHGSSSSKNHGRTDHSKAYAVASQKNENKPMAIYEVQGDDPSIKRKNKSKKEKKEKKKNKKSKKSKKKSKKNQKQEKTECDTEEDCNGGCCVPRKGKKICSKSSFREIGDKCATSCVCNSGLKCFVGEYKRNGEKKVRKPGKRVLGRCIDPTTADQTQGFFIDENNSK